MKENLYNRIKRRWIPWLLALILKRVLKTILWTCKIEVFGIEHFLKTAASQSCILMLWHNRLTAIAQVLERHAPHFKYVAFVSKSRDGEIVAAFTESFKGARTIRVAHQSREVALKAMIHELKESKDVVLITPDGPKGPPGEMKPGVLFAAQESGAPIVPFSWSASQYWTMNTWDKLRIPKPFSTIRACFGQPISPLPHTTIDDLKQSLQRLEDLKFPG